MEHAAGIIVIEIKRCNVGSGSLGVCVSGGSRQGLRLSGGRVWLNLGEDERWSDQERKSKTGDLPIGLSDSEPLQRSAWRPEEG